MSGLIAGKMVCHERSWSRIARTTMSIYHGFILAFWLVFAGIWLVAAGFAKRTADGGRTWRREIAMRLVILVLVVVALHLLRISGTMRVLRPHVVNRNAVAGVIGVVVCGAGVALAVFARIHIGRNWGMPMSRKQQPELVTTGPYAVVRHPIYAGILLAIVGSAIGLSMFWLLALVAAVPYFVYSARREERLMAEEFPEQYPAYMRRTKMLLPWL